jgi:outer membrane lipoprotein-sorting protein
MKARLLILALAASAALACTAPAITAPSEAAQNIANHFSGVKTLTGEFVQFGPKGEQTGGKFFIERPGKIRFNYEKPSPIRVVADGKSVVINNKKLDTWDMYTLDKTPLKLLLSEKINLSDGKVKDIREEADLTTIVLADKTVFGDSKISMMFDPNNYDLRQWTITDAKGLDTTVMIFNVEEGAKLDPELFKIDYLRINEANQKRVNGK